MASCRTEMKNWDIQVAAHKQESSEPMQLHSMYSRQGSPGMATLRRATLGKRGGVEAVLHGKTDNEAITVRGRPTANTRDGIYPHMN